MSDAERAIRLAEQILQKAEDYPQALVQCALMLLADPASEGMQTVFLETYQYASAAKSLCIGPGLPFAPDALSYYSPPELNQPGIEIGTEPIQGWKLKLFPDQLRRHCAVLGMTGSGKTNLLRLIALGLGEMDK